MQWTRIAAGSQSIIALRMLGMSGLRPSDPDENGRMVQEKLLALWQSALSAGQVMQRGGSAIDIARAATVPVARKTRANLRRLR